MSKFATIAFTNVCLLCCIACSPLIKTSERNKVAKKDVLQIIEKVNNYWQAGHPNQGNSSWDNAVYHTGNMEAYWLTGKEAYKDYSEAWAEKNQWMGATSVNKAEWKSTYGEKPEFVLFGDWQVCFQTYIDLYKLGKDSSRIARVKEVMEYQMSTARNDYWWWVDGLYMVMPVMTKMYKVTGNQLYLEKMHEYFNYANSIMYDKESGLYFRDGRYVYPQHATLNGKKDFWARGDGWVFAALTKVLNDLPNDNIYRHEYIEKFQGIAKTIIAYQQPEGYWTRSIMDPMYAPGAETSGTAFFTYGLLWGINHGLLNKNEYLPAALKGWKYLTQTALQPDGKIGFVQPIGDRAIPGQVIDKSSTTNFGVAAFLFAACEMYRYLDFKK